MLAGLALQIDRARGLAFEQLALTTLGRGDLTENNPPPPPPLTYCPRSSHLPA